jgi:hypothetical protein
MINNQFRLVRREFYIFLNLIFRPTMLPHVMFVDLVATKIKQLRPALNDGLPGLRAGTVTFPSPGDAVAVVAAIGFLNSKIADVLEPTAQPVPQAVACM